MENNWDIKHFACLFGSMYNLFAAEEYAKKKLNYIPAILRYTAYGIGIFCSGYVINLIVNNFM